MLGISDVHSEPGMSEMVFVELALSSALDLRRLSIRSRRLLRC
jgi:hypothetical protein